MSKRKFRIYGYLTISVTAEIEAPNRSQAKILARDLAPPTLCHQCDGAGGDGCWTLNGFDDPPDDAVQDVEEIK